MPLPRLWLITMPEDPRGPVEPVERALAGCPAGLCGVQLRAKTSSDRQVVNWGHALRRITHAHRSPLLVNGRADLAAIVDADGVHLPERHVGVGAVRSIGGATWIVGVSCHDRSGLERARDEGADFAFLSPVFAVPNKGCPMGIEGFERTIQGVGIPTFGLGGVEPSHVQPLIAAEAAGVALRRPVYADDPTASLGRYLHELDKNAPAGA